jgi:hypothetical protein
MLHRYRLPTLFWRCFPLVSSDRLHTRASRMAAMRVVPPHKRLFLHNTVCSAMFSTNCLGSRERSSSVTPSWIHRVPWAWTLRAYSCVRVSAAASSAGRRRSTEKRQALLPPPLSSVFWRVEQKRVRSSPTAGVVGCVCARPLLPNARGPVCCVRTHERIPFYQFFVRPCQFACQFGQRQGATPARWHQRLRRRFRSMCRQKLLCSLSPQSADPCPSYWLAAFGAFVHVALHAHAVGVAADVSTPLLTCPRSPIESLRKQASHDTRDPEASSTDDANEMLPSTARLMDSADVDKVRCVSAVGRRSSGRAPHTAVHLHRSLLPARGKPQW